MWPLNCVLLQSNVYKAKKYTVLNYLYTENFEIKSLEMNTKVLNSLIFAFSLLGNLMRKWPKKLLRLEKFHTTLT